MEEELQVKKPEIYTFFWPKDSLRRHFLEANCDQVLTILFLRKDDDNVTNVAVI